MKEKIDIRVDEQKLARNDEKKERLRKANAFEPVDRVPVAVNSNQWTALAARGVSPADYLRSPEDNLREQVLNQKWRLENVHDDTPIPPEKLSFGPDLGCLRGTEFDMDITWLEDGPPKCEHPLTEPEQIDDLTIPDPANSINGKKIAWYHAMTEAAQNLEVTLNGKPLEITINLAYPGGPIPSAFALAGSNLFLWMAMDPDRIHRLMDIVTESHLNCKQYFDDMMGRKEINGTGLGCDTGEMLSPEMFKEFVVPYYLRIYEAYPGPRGFHNCGQNEHLLDSMRDDLEITSHNGFGFCVDPDVLKEKMAGRVILKGGPDPSLIKSGPWEDIVSSAEDYIQTLGPHGGYILCIGGGAAPGTPEEHYEALVQASKEMGNVQAN